MLEEEDEQLSDEELAHWLAFHALKGFGPKRVALLDERLQSLKTAWNASERVLDRIDGIGPESIATLNRGRAEIDPQRLLENFKKSGMKAWTWKNPHYPLRLKHIHDAPLILFVNGDISVEAMNHVVGVVGTRFPTQYGKRIAFDVAQGFSAHGVTVISGMAAGCDALAHWGAIKGGAPTIAVLGCGADVCYPPGNQDLFDAIKDGKGVVISEYLPGTQPETFHFPERNRIIAGLCHALVVVEGTITSGSMITAKLAFEQSREVFAFPGRIDSRMSEGPNWLVAAESARLCRSYEDVLNFMNWAKTRTGPERDRPSVVQLYGREKEVYELISHDPVHFDKLCEQASMEAGELSATLTMLELAGLIHRDVGDWYTRFTDLQIRR